jgi:hypothetical protein
VFVGPIVGRPERGMKMVAQCETSSHGAPKG